MKTYCCIYLSLILMTTTLTFAQEPLSFRNKALGGIVNDDLDLVYDPVELRFVDTLHLYTNLSNLTSTQEQLFNNFSDNEFLIGASRKNPWLDHVWTSVLARFQKSKSPDPVSIDTDLNGFPDDFGSGTLQDEYTAYQDINGNGLYDIKRSISQTKSSNQLTDGYSVVLNNSFLLHDWTLGIKIAFGTQTVERNTASLPLGSARSFLFGTNVNDPTFSRSVEEFLIDSNYADLRWSEKGDFNTTDDNPLFRLAAAAMVPVNDFEFRGDVQYHKVKNSTETNDSYTGGYEFLNPNIAGYAQNYFENATNTGTLGTDGNGFGFGGSARYTFDKQPYRRNDGFVALGINAGFESFDYTNSSIQKFSSTETEFDSTGPLVDFARQIGSTTSSTDNGDGKTNMVQFLGRINVPLADGVMFGLGGAYTLSNLERNTAFAEDGLTTTNYARTDNIQNALDTLRTESSGLTANRTFKTHARTLTIPVGIEYYFTENHHWAIRFCSVFQYSSLTTDDALQITNSRPFTTKTVLGSGTTTVTVQNNIYTSRSQHTEDGISSTFFTYGLGYFPTNNLQVDVLGFFDVNNHVTLLELLKSLRLSFMLKI